MRRHIDYGKYNAQKISHTVKTKYISGGLLSRPLWMDAVDAFPPVPTPTRLRSHDPTNHDSMIPANSSKISDDRMNQLQEYCQGMGTFKWFKMYRKNAMKVNSASRLKAVKDADSVYAFPRDIVYPEDALRQKFYQDHPLEQFSVRSLQERVERDKQERTTQKILNDMFPGTAASSSLSTQEKGNSLDDGEAVVRYQLELMENQKISVDDAYKAACSKFYADKAKIQKVIDEKRADEELKLKEAREKLEAERKLAADLAAADANVDQITAESVDTEESKEPSDIDALLELQSTTHTEKSEIDLLDGTPKVLTAAEEWLKLEEEAFEKGCALKYQEQITRNLSNASRRQSTAT